MLRVTGPKGLGLMLPASVYRLHAIKRYQLDKVALGHCNTDTQRPGQSVSCTFFIPNESVSSSGYLAPRSPPKKTKNKKKTFEYIISPQIRPHKSGHSQIPLPGCGSALRVLFVLGCCVVFRRLSGQHHMPTQLNLEDRKQTEKETEVKHSRSLVLYILIWAMRKGHCR